MTRAEEAANKAYPKYWAKAILYDGQTVKFDAGEEKRMVFIQGYELAEKDIILRTKKWIAEIHRVCDITDEHGYSIELRDLIASFEKSLGEEV